MVEDESRLVINGSVWTTCKAFHANLKNDIVFVINLVINSLVSIQ